MTTPKRIDQQRPLSWQDAPEMLSPPMCARVLGQHTNTINKALQAGKIPFTRVGSHRKIKKSDLAEYAGITLDSNGSATPTADILVTYANEIEMAMTLPAAQMLVALEDIAERMKNH